MITILTTIGELSIEPDDIVGDIALHWNDGRLCYTHIPTKLQIPANLDHLPIVNIYNLASDISDLLKEMSSPCSDNPLHQAIMQQLVSVLVENNALNRGNE